MAPTGANIVDSGLGVMAAYQGFWGQRIAASISKNSPPEWRVSVWEAPRCIPPVVDDPEEYLTSPIIHSDLLVALGETPGFAQLVPMIAKRAGVRAAVVPVDRNASLPAGLVGQLAGWLREAGVVAVFPRPLCSLDEEGYNRAPIRMPYDDETIRRFARYFGRPKYELSAEGGRLSSVRVLRDACCGCARFVAEGLSGVPVGEAVEAAGMLHHHYPCLASMNIDEDYQDTLMHVSGNLLRDEIQREVESILPTVYLRPSNLVDSL
ncbi:MAG: DUF166 family protein [Anaerolineales bacterium]|jgi:hypothetical protein